MAAWALILGVGYLLVVFGLNTVLQMRASGSSGWVHGVGATGAERAASALFLLAWALDLLGPALILTGVLGPVSALNHTLVHVAGFVLIGVATLGARQAQVSMGAAWRTGIDPGRSQHLVTWGLFATVRNPVYVTVMAASLGIALLAPTVVAVLALLICLVSLEVQTRLVEEPFLLRRHGGAYLAYTDAVGRFIPKTGHLVHRV